MARHYEQSHPWINFSVALDRLPASVWLLLGAIQAKIAVVRHLPIHPEYAVDFRATYISKGVLGTTAIEGNTLSEQQVKAILERTLTLPPSKEYLEQQVNNVLDLYNEIVDAKPLYTRPYTSEKLAAYNRILLDALPNAEEVSPGGLRHHEVSVGRYRGAPPEDCLYLTARLCDWLNQPLHTVRGFELATEIVRAILGHLFLAWIDPFADGNGRTARALEFSVLYCAGVPDVAVHLLSSFYNQTRDEYYRQLDRSSRSDDHFVPFLLYALQGFHDALDEQLAAIEGAQIKVHWRDLIHRAFDGKTSEAATRRKNLVLDLAERYVDKPIRIAQVPELSPRLARAYSGLSSKALQRDITELVRMELVDASSRMVRARIRNLSPFLPRQFSPLQPSSGTSSQGQSELAET